MLLLETERAKMAVQRDLFAPSFQYATHLFDKMSRDYNAFETVIDGWQHYTLTIGNISLRLSETSWM